MSQLMLVVWHNHVLMRQHVFQILPYLQDTHAIVKQAIQVLRAKMMKEYAKRIHAGKIFLELSN